MLSPLNKRSMDPRVREDDGASASDLGCWRRHSQGL